MDKPEFWMKKDDISMARSLRLSVIRNLFEQGMLTESEAKEILSGPLSPDNPLTVFDDSRWLTESFKEWEPDKI